MAGNKIHGSVLPVTVRIDIPGTGDAQGGCLGHAPVSLDMAAHVVPVPAVPLRPPVPGRESAHLVKSVCIPGLGYELYIAQNGVKGKGLKQGRLAHGSAVLAASHNGSQVKTEPVNPVGRDPVAQAVDNHLLHNGVIAVHGIAAAAEIVVISLRGQQIIYIVVKSLK